jgi:hypothetical protein
MGVIWRNSHNQALGPSRRGKKDAWAEDANDDEAMAEALLNSASADRPLEVTQVAVLHRIVQTLLRLAVAAAQVENAGHSL